MSSWKRTGKLAGFPRLRAGVGCVRGLVRRLSPSARAADHRVAAERKAAELSMDALASNAGGSFQGRTLIDGSFDNPNYWLRFSFVRAALGLKNGRETGLLGPYQRDRVRKTFRHFGVTRTVSFPDLPVSGDARRLADDLVSRTRIADDVLSWTLPENFPAMMVYDGILKRQRLATVNVSRADFRGHVREAVESIERARRVIEDGNYDLVVISHPFNFLYGGLAWCALRRGIPVLLPFGAFGTMRVTRFDRPEELFSFYDRPTAEDFATVAPEKLAAMEQVGGQYLDARLGGRADDLASIYAFRDSSECIDRAALHAKFGWDPAKPIVAVYASNWFDWPHQLGMSQFRDFLDWTETTFEAARKNDKVNWLFKPHPAEDWFGGASLSSIMAKIGTASHVALCEKSWNNTAVMQTVDALVTYHGTAGIEFASRGKPVLIPDRGKYDDIGFAKVASSRQNYLDLLATEWWRGMDMSRSAQLANTFAGWWICAPDWQSDMLLEDDPRQNAIYSSIPDLLNHHADVVGREISYLRDWFASGRRFSHTYKMARAERYRLTNVRA
jgi:hypothetical protein